MGPWRSMGNSGVPDTVAFASRPARCEEADVLNHVERRQLDPPGTVRTSKTSRGGVLLELGGELGEILDPGRRLGVRI
jgi:hypothetical protein